MTVHLKWEVGVDLRGANRLYLKLGKYKISEVYWDGMGARESKDRYRCYVSLPGIKPMQGVHMTQEIAQARAMACVNHWLKGAGLADEHGAIVEGQNAQQI